ncbi:MAG: metallophosphoesterase family protein [Candidatus Thorarchaeota archaeon]|nr:MAG: phosphoesterase [Mycoplasmatota bacterium]HEC72602.1 phosphoesterase [Thermoplasmatales archaeon]
MGYFFTADEHYSHAKIIEYTNRPFSSVEEMNAQIIKRHNEIVTPQDITIHAGDFCFGNKKDAEAILRKLNGNHVLLRGSHDSWMGGSYHEVWTKTLNGQPIVVCHYAGRVWHKSHYNSWQLFGHSHGGLPPIGKQWDIGVDNNNFYPFSLDKIEAIMSKQPNNFNFLRNKEQR